MELLDKPLDRSDVIALAALLATLLGIAISIWLAFRSSWQDHAAFLEDPEERARRIAELRGGSFGKLYPTWLERSLDLLDRRLGEPFSPKALNVCTLLALGYAYVFFFLAYVVGAPGGLGEDMAWLPSVERMTITARLLIASMSILAPPLAFFLARLLSRFFVRWERRLKLGMRRRVEVGYRALLALIIGGLVFWFASLSNDAALIAFSSGLGALSAAGALLGYGLACRSALPWLQSPAAALISALAGTLAIAAALAVSVAAAGALALALAGALALALAGAGAGAVAVVLAYALAYAVIVGLDVGLDVTLDLGLDVALDVAFAVAGTVAVAVAAGVGAGFAVLGKRRTGQRGLYTGALGPWLGVALIAALFGADKQFADGVVVLWITLFLALPSVNGLWDFGSWWVSRSLGRHLLTKLQGKGGAGGQGWTIFWHISFDLFLAIVFLLSLSWFLGFAFQSYHNIGVWYGGAENAPLALPAYIDAAAAAPFGEGLWVSAMLLSTLIPTFLHAAMVIAGALTLFTPVTAARMRLADDLETLETVDADQRKIILQRAGRHFANGRHGLWAFAMLLLLILLALLSAAIAAIHTGGFAEYVASAAHEGVSFSDWLFAMAQ